MHETLTDKDRAYLRWTLAGAQEFKRCLRRQAFALLLDTHWHVIGQGYNGTAPGATNCTDGGCPRALTTVPHGSAYSSDEDRCKAAHAEANALLHSDYTARRKGSVMYCNTTPCWNCAILIAHGSVTRLVCITDGLDADWPTVKAYLEETGVQIDTATMGELTSGR